MADASPLRGSEGGHLPVVGIEQLALCMARAMGQLITRQRMELQLGQVEVGPSAFVQDGTGTEYQGSLINLFLWRI